MLERIEQLEANIILLAIKLEIHFLTPLNISCETLDMSLLVQILNVIWVWNSN